MTFLAKDIRDHLVGSAAIVNAVSDRIFPDAIPQEKRSSGQRMALYPCIVLEDISNDPEMYLGGEAGTHTSMIQIDVWVVDSGNGKHKANEISELVRNRLNGYRGVFGTGCYGTARMERKSSPITSPADGSDTYTRRVSMDFEIIHSADVPTFT